MARSTCRYMRWKIHDNARIAHPRRHVIVVVFHSGTRGISAKRVHEELADLMEVCRPHQTSSQFPCMHSESTRDRYRPFDSICKPAYIILDAASVTMGLGVSLLQKHGEQRPKIGRTYAWPTPRDTHLRSSSFKCPRMTPTCISSVCNRSLLTSSLINF